MTALAALTGLAVFIDMSGVIFRSWIQGVQTRGVPPCSMKESYYYLLG